MTLTTGCANGGSVMSMLDNGDGGGVIGHPVISVSMTVVVVKVSMMVVLVVFICASIFCTYLRWLVGPLLTVNRFIFQPC